MRIKLIALSLLATVRLIGQCPEFSNTIALTSQSQVDAFLADFPSCEELNNDLIIGHFGAPVSTDINDLSGFSALKRINGELRVRNVDLLESFDGLHNIEHIGEDLIIGDNELLKNLSDFKNIDSIGGDFDIYGNPNLEVLFEGDSILFVGGSLRIRNNNTLDQISGFQQLRSIGGDIEIAGNPELISTEGFNNLETINGTLDIYESPQLQDLSGFEMLAIIKDGMEVRGSGISDFTGLSNLRKIEGRLAGNSVSITDNFNLRSLNGLENVDTIQRSLFLTGNEQLESIAALSNLTYMGGQLSIRNSNLSDISALNGIAPLTATIEIRENPNLIAIDQLPLASSIGGRIEIRDNNSLLDISSVGSVDTLFGQLNIRDNISLSDCVSLCPLLTTGFVENIITIRGNLGSCETEDDLRLLCTTSSQDIDEKEPVQIFPNPTESIVKIKALASIHEVLVYRADGSLLKSLKYNQGLYEVSLDITDLESGFYFIELVLDENRTIKKIIKQ